MCHAESAGSPPNLSRMVPFVLRLSVQVAAVAVVVAAVAVAV